MEPFKFSPMYINFLVSYDVPTILETIKNSSMKIPGYDFQKNYQNLFHSSFLKKLLTHKEKNYIRKIELSSYFPDIPSEHKAILDLDTAQIYRYLISSAERCNGKISRSCFNAFVNFNFEADYFIILISVVLDEILELKITYPETKDFLLKLLESEDFEIINGQAEVRILRLISSLKISPKDFLNTVGSKITLKNSIRLVKILLTASRFNKEFIDWMFKHYINSEHLIAIEFLPPYYINRTEIEEIVKSIISESVFLDFENSSDKYQFLIDLKSTISGYPRKLQRFILGTLFENYASRHLTTDQELQNPIKKEFLNKILNDSDIDMSHLRSNVYGFVMSEFGYEGFKKLFSHSEYKEGLFESIFGRNMSILLLILKDPDIKDESIVEILSIYRNNYPEFNSFENIELDLVRCKRFFIVLKKLMGSTLQTQSITSNPGIIPTIRDLSLNNMSPFRVYRSFFEN